MFFFKWFLLFEVKDNMCFLFGEAELNSVQLTCHNTIISPKEQQQHKRCKQRKTENVAPFSSSFIGSFPKAWKAILPVTVKRNLFEDIFFQLQTLWENLNFYIFHTF